MDHEFGTSACEDALGWDWFSVQLADGSADVGALRLADGGVERASWGRWPDGEQTPVQTGAVGRGRWVSPHTASLIRQVAHTLPAQALRLTVTPLVRDQEMRVSYVYWEAPPRRGRARRQPVAGRYVG